MKDHSYLPNRQTSLIIVYHECLYLCKHNSLPLGPINLLLLPSSIVRPFDKFHWMIPHLSERLSSGGV